VTKKALGALLTPIAGDLSAPNAVAVVPAGGVAAADVVAFAATDDLSAEALRQAAGAATSTLTGRRHVALVSPSDEPDTIAAIAQGAALGAYRFTAYRTETPSTKAAPERITVCAPTARKGSVKRAVSAADVISAAVGQVRDLVNTAPVDLTPDAFATAIRRAAADTSVRVEIFDENKLARQGYGGILAVGQGSAHPPRLVRMVYRPAKARIGAHLGLVGKGVTFDSGGLSLKPPTGMITMKCDMAGAATVAWATLAIAQLGLPIKVTTYLPLVENMPSGTAQRPGDVYTAYNGTTVEVLNTDAEGRLILADALARAAKDSPDLLIDVATLTGAQMVALGTEVSAAMGNNDDARDRVVAAAGAAGEQMWPMPLPAALRASLDSKVADIANIGERMGGMLVAGLFLAEFVPQSQPWVHLDIAGPAFNEGKPHGYTPVGGTGHAVRTLVELATELAG
jgi:leucyl aminopeptidase